VRILAIFLIIMIALGALTGWWVGRSFSLPQIQTLKTFRPAQATEFLDKDGRVFASYAVEKRLLLKAEEIPFTLKAAVISAEDKDFYKHGGVSIPSILRALWRDLRERRFAQGGSTITQQLSKMLFLSPQKKLKRKIEEALLAFNLEKALSKEEILALYINLVNFGHGNYGAVMAGDFYFGKSPDKLSLDETALLAGLIRTPGRDSPLKSPERALARRNEILRRMHRNGYISAEQFKELSERPLDLALGRRKADVGHYFGEEVRRYLQKRYGDEKLYRAGLRVSTTLDQDLQKVAETSLRLGLEAIDRLKGYRKGTVVSVLEEQPDLERYAHPTWRFVSAFEPGVLYWGLVTGIEGDTAWVRIAEERFLLKRGGWAWTQFQDIGNLLRVGDLARFSIDEKGALYLNQEPAVQGAVVVLENGTGKVRALVGGTDFERSEFDRAVQALRQPGSAFKPFVFAAALEHGYTLGDTVLDAPVSLYAGPNQPMYSPRNYYGQYYGIVTLREALEQSHNVSAVKLFLMVGPEKVLDMAARAGLTRPIPPFASSALGAAEVTPMELTAAYATFANLGICVEPYFIERVQEGEKVMEKNGPTVRQGLSPAVAYLTLHAMEGVIDRGTAAAAADIPLPLAGKTGTTSEYTDAWFVGFSPSYTVGVWIGNDQKKPIGRGMTGGRAALPTWMRILRWMADRGYEQRTAFTVPPGVSTALIDRTTGFRAIPECADTLDEAYLSGTEPESYCSDKWHAIGRLPYYQQAPFYSFKQGEPQEIALVPAPPGKEEP